jgi:hypothetical protein
MQLSHKAPATDTPRLEIPLRNKTRTTRSSGTETKCGPRKTLSAEKQSDNASRQHPCSFKRTSEEDDDNARQSAPKGTSRAEGGDSAGRRARLAGPNGNGDHSNRSGSGSRRRALIQDSSDDEDGVNATPLPHHLSLLKGKALPSHDSDIDMQLADVSPEHGGSSLQLSVSNDDFVAALNLTAHRLDITNLADRTPPTTSHKSPMNTTMSDNHSAKRRRGEAGGLSSIPDSHKSHNTRHKEAIPSIAIVSHMWLGFAIHEAIASHQSKGIIHEHRTNEEFKSIGTPTREVIEFKTLRRAFPRVPQLLYSNERPDAVPGNHLNFTQLPRHERVDPTTGLSEGFHITIRFDFGYKNMNRQDVRGACLERLRHMDISLGSTYANPIDVGINAVTKNWAGFIKVHLLHPLQDGIALLKGHRAFVMTMEDGEKVIGKIEKDYELVTKARNLRLHLRGETLRHEHAFSIFESLVQESYYSGHQHEYMGLTKPEIDKDYAFVTFTMEEARDMVLNDGLIYNNERLQVSIPRDRNVGNPSELRISTTLVANNLPQRESQAAITKALSKSSARATL